MGDNCNLGSHQNLSHMHASALEFSRSLTKFSLRTENLSENGNQVDWAGRLKLLSFSCFHAGERTEVGMNDDSLSHYQR